jgi:hypothetical protein
MKSGRKAENELILRSRFAGDFPEPPPVRGAFLGASLARRRQGELSVR